ncbi:hypothetical protein FRB93_011868 [Tulasnella sp. JGI-2019a]|nr:hypothetical protein FRB93_011868 [Tulasnella sp. JGI-2019a]
MPTPGHSCSPLTTETRGDVVSPAPISGPQVHPKYDDELVNLIVENRIYHISKILLSQSTPFSAVLRSYSGGQLISLTGVSTSELESFLEVLHTRQIEAPLHLQPAEWGDALYLSTKWGFSAIREHVIKQIEVQCEHQGPLDLFELALKCRVSQWLRHVYHTLCVRGEYITAEEGRRLGYERLTAICRIREILCDTSRPNPVGDQCGRCDHCYTKRPCRFPLEASGEDALEWIDEAEYLQASYYGLEGEIGVTVSAPSPRVVPENLNKQGSAIKDSIPATNIRDNIRDGVESVLPFPPQYQTEALQDPVNLATKVHIKDTCSPTPMITDSGDPSISTQTATIEESAQVTFFNDESENMPSIVQVPQRGGMQSVPGAASDTYIEITRPSTPTHLNLQSTGSSGYAPLIEELPSTMDNLGETAKPSPTMPNVVQTPHHLIPERYVEAFHIEAPSTTIGTTTAHQELANPVVVTNDRFASTPLAVMVTGAIQGKSKKQEGVCQICWKAKPNLSKRRKVCEPCRGMPICVVCRLFKMKVEERTRTCKGCRREARRKILEAGMAAEFIADYVAATQKSPVAVATGAVRSTNPPRSSTDVAGSCDASSAALIEHLIASRLAEIGALGPKNGGTRRWGLCVACGQPKSKTTALTPKCKACQRYTGVAMAAITKHLVDSRKSMVDAPAFEQQNTPVSNPIPAIPSPFTPAAFNSSVGFTTEPSPAVMDDGGDGEVDPREWDRDTSSQGDREEFLFVNSDSEGSAM